VKAGPRSKLDSDGQWPAFTPAVILFIALPETQDKATFPLELLPRRCPQCGDDTSSVMASGASRRTTGATTGSGYDAESVVRAARPSRSCPIGWRLRRISACVADSRPVRASPRVLPLSRPRRTAKIRRARPIHQPCGRWARRRLLSLWSWLTIGAMGCIFSGRPPSLPGISARSAVFCQSRQKVHDSNGAR